MMPTPMTVVMAMITRISVPMKNWRVTEQPEYHSGGHRSASPSDQQLVEAGHDQAAGREAIPSIRWASARLTSTKGENP